MPAKRLGRRVSESEKLRLAEIRLLRTVDAAYHALLAATAWMGIKESKREAFIAEHMSNVKFCAENNVACDYISKKPVAEIE